MGIQAMISSLKNNKRTKRNQFDKNNTGTESNYGDFVDHKKMSAYEYEVFQKKVFNEKKTSETDVLPHSFTHRYNCYYNSSPTSNSLEVYI